MDMISHRIIEGTGEEIAQYTQQHPKERFQLITVDVQKADPRKRGGPDSRTWKEIQEFKHSLKGKMGALPLEATSTEALYD